MKQPKLEQRIVEGLRTLLPVYSPSGHEGAMVKTILGMLGSLENVTLHGNNILVGRESAPVCLNAHLDHVTPFGSRKRRKLRPVFRGGVIGQMAHEAEGPLGLDDKVGIAIALSLYEDFGRRDDISLLFTAEEETGGFGGAASLPADWRFGMVITCDRKGTGHVVSDIGMPILSLGAARDIMENVLAPALWKYTEGAFADPVTLVENGTAANAVNIECGYYLPHTPQEFGVVSEMVAAAEIAAAIATLALEKGKDWEPVEFDTDYDWLAEEDGQEADPWEQHRFPEFGPEELAG